MNAVLAARGITLQPGDDGWYAEGRYKPGYPNQLAYGRTRLKALRRLRRHFDTWVF